MTARMPHNPEPDATPTLAAGQDARRGWRLPELGLSGFMRRLGRVLDIGSRAPRVERDPRAQLRVWCHEACDKRGKIAGLMAIAKVADAYRQLDAAGKDAFFDLLLDEFSVHPDTLEGAIAEYLAATQQDGFNGDDDGDGNGADSAHGAVARGQALVRLSRALESPRLALFEQFNTIPAGIKVLVDLRADLAARLERNAALAPLEYELHRKLVSFFNLGFLELQRLGWDSPAALLEKLIETEAVHHIGTWDDLKHRLVSDRACFAFVHPAMPLEPVIFVEVAFVRGLADNIQQLLDRDAPDLLPEDADTAIFYGISNAQAGLRGIPFGNLLIKQVAAQLHAEVPNLETFATLSPLPRLRRDFLDAAIADGSVAAYFKSDEARILCFVAQAPDAAAAVRELLAEPEWHRNPDAAAALRPGLLRAARHYLAERLHNGHAACPVAHFHGANGAQLQRINWLGDTSPNGLAQSAGLMANYLYDMDAFEAHQSDYLRGGHVAVSKEIGAL